MLDDRLEGGDIERLLGEHDWDTNLLAPHEMTTAQLIEWIDDQLDTTRF